MLTSKGNMLCKNPTGRLRYERLPTITLKKIKLHGHIQLKKMLDFDGETLI